MGELVGVIVTALLAFAITNVDGFLLIMLLFSQLNRRLHASHVVAGTYLGFSGLIAISLVGYLGTLLAPRHSIGLLGLVPIYLGVRALVGRDGNAAMDEPIRQREPQPWRTAKRQTGTSLLSPPTYQVAVLSVASGGDNVSVYVPLFAGLSLDHLAVTLAAFYLLLGVWCYLGHAAANQRAIAAAIERYGDRTVPWVYVGLGLWIVVRQGTLAVLFGL